MERPRLVIPDVCGFLCTPGDETCMGFCNTFRNCPLSPNMLYNYVRGIADNAELFTTGVGALVQDRARMLALRIALYQQLPWFIVTVLIIIALIYAGVISPVTGVVIIIIAIALIVGALFLSYHDTQHTLATTVPEVRDLLNRDYIEARTTISDRLSPIILQTVIDARLATC